MGNSPAATSAWGRVVYYYRLANMCRSLVAISMGNTAETGNTWQQRADVSGGDLVKAGSLFLAADTFLGPFYFAYGRASGGASSFYLFLGRRVKAIVDESAMTNALWLARSRAAVWHPCTQMKLHETLPLVPIRAAPEPG